MKQKAVERILKESVDGRKIMGASLLRIDGSVISSHFVGLSDVTANLIARDILSGRRRRRAVFPILGKPVASVAVHDKMCLGLLSLGKETYVFLIGGSGFSLPRFYAHLQRVSRRLGSAVS
jgi:hypothetical protein